MKAEEALYRLIEGNLRYAEDSLENPNRCIFRRQETKLVQNPFATVVGCSDSRVPPEIIFDRGLGDLFTVRVAGNVIGAIEKDSIDFSVRTLGSSLILVLGHESCGAVEAVFRGQGKEIEKVASLIAPSIQGAKDVNSAVIANVKNMVELLKKDPYFHLQEEKGLLKIVGGYYSLGSGKVTILFDAPLKKM